MTPCSNDAPYCLLPSCKKLENFNDRFQRKWSKTTIFDTWSHLLPGLRFFSKFRPCHFFYYIDPQLHTKFRKKTNEWSLRYIKTDRQTHWQTDTQTDHKGVITKDPFGYTRGLWGLDSDIWLECDMESHVWLKR